jgi:N-acetylglucosamine kinase-like BadF-type ATPase
MSVFSDVVIGVDGGGTKTAIVVVGLPSKVVNRSNPELPHTLALVTGASTNPNSVGKTAAAETLASTMENAMSIAYDKAGGSTALNVRAVCLGMSGVDRKSDIALVEEWVAQGMKKIVDNAHATCVTDSKNVLVYNDAIAALASGTLGELYGIVCIAGTGTISLGRNRKGDEFRAGGWGALTDDGSGFQIAIQTLKAVWAAHDTSGPETSLVEAVKSKLGIDNTEDIIGWTYDDLTWANIASITPVTFAEAANGDAVACGILDSASDALVRTITTVARRLNFTSDDAKDQDIPIVLSGSVARNPAMKKRVSTRLNDRLDNVALLEPIVDAAMGSALLAVSHALK